MRTRKLSQRRLAAEIKARGGEATGAAISDVLSGKRGTSKLIPLINEILGGTPPKQVTLKPSASDEARARIDRLLDKINDDDAKHVLDLLERLTRPR